MEQRWGDVRIRVAEYERLSAQDGREGPPRELWEHFPPPLRGQLQGSASAARKWEHYRAWALLEELVREELGLEGLRSLDIARTPNGKPYSASHPELFFNLSHCAAGCACAAAPFPVGIDMERKFLYREALARKICHEREWECLQSLPGTRSREGFLQALWSVKESAVKMTGDGLGYEFARLDVSSLLGQAWEGAVWGAEGCGEASGAAGDLGAVRILVMSRRQYTLAVCRKEKETRPGRGGRPPQKEGLQ